MRQRPTTPSTRLNSWLTLDKARARIIINSLKVSIARVSKVVVELARTSPGRSDACRSGQERAPVPRETLGETSRLPGINRNSPAPKSVECLQEGECRSRLLSGTGPATVDSPRQVTAIRIATLNRDDGI